MRLGLAFTALVLGGLGLCCRGERTSGARPAPGSEASVGAKGLKGPAAFADISDSTARAQALFTEMGKVLQHPRCINCHPQAERPQQGEDGLPHEPMVVRGMGGVGAAGMFCPTCHGPKNYRTVPGNAKWLLAPEEMAWVGRSLSDICTQLKDEKRNGGRDLEAIHTHLAEDDLVGYGWNPPAHLTPAPGTQEVLAALFRAWMDAGAHCPSS